MPKRFRPDATTKEVIALVNRKFPNHPGKLEQFRLARDAEASRQALDDFIEHRLPSFGEYQDAMWTDEPYLYHSRISAALNLKLLDPREVIEEAVVAYRGWPRAPEQRRRFRATDSRLARIRARHLLALHARVPASETRWTRRSRCRSSTGPARRT